MKTKRTGLIVALCFFAAAAVSFADDPLMGTWKLNEAKSKLAPGAPKNHTVVYETASDNVKITVDGTDKDGNSTHNEWTGKFDGKDYPVTGDPTSDMRSYQKVGDRVLKMKIKKDGKVTVTGRIIVSPMANPAWSARAKPVRRARAPQTGQYTTSSNGTESSLELTIL